MSYKDMWYFFSIISFCFAEDLFMVTTNPNGKVHEDGKFRFINIPKTLEMKAHTVCLRFKTVKFAGLQCILANDYECLLETVAGEKCGGSDMECFNKQNIIKSGWDTKKVFALWREDPIEVWRPEVWNTLCWTKDAQETNDFKLIINGKIMHSEYIRKEDNWAWIDFQYMNFGDREPHNGAITDVNIWNRALSSRDLNSWRVCNSQEIGNILNWTSVQLEITGLTKEKINKSELCHIAADDQLFKAFNKRLGFFESVIFCQRFGEIATARDKVSVDRMIEAYDKIDKRICDDFGSHGGITFRQQENRNFELSISSGTISGLKKIFLLILSVRRNSLGST